MSTESPTPGSPAPVKEGDVLASKYRVEKVLGVGGMGVVVAAEHIELSQKVALKFLLKQAAANDDLVQRFLREARASVRLKGSHVAKTLDVGRLDDGCPYIVMEFLEGHDLHAELRGKGTLSVEDAVSYVVQAAEGLAEAHSLGIVHRDLKPGNLFLTRGVDGRPLVKVLDFGISKTMDPGAGGDGLSLTKTEMLLGSPLYMSPEQMRSSKHVDERSDLWALGCIAFELLTGHVPFEADTILELCFKVAQEKAASPALLRPDLPDALCNAVLKCLEKSPDDRFANVGELAQAFEPFALPRDRGTAERALDVLGTGKRPPMRSISPEVAALAPVTPAPTPAPAVPATPVPAPTPAPGVPQATASQVEPIAPAAWGTTQAQPANRSKKGLFAVVGAVVVVASVAGVVVSRRDASTPANALVPSSTSSTTVANGAAVAPPSAPAPSEAAPLPEGHALAAAVAAAGDAGAAPVASAAPATPTAHAVAGNKPVVKAAGAVVSAPSAAAAASAKNVKPATSAAAPATPAADPAGFIKVRE